MLILLKTGKLRHTNFFDAMKKFTPIRLLALGTIVFSTLSCNRGYGCPTNFSLEEVFEFTFQWAVSFLF